MKNNKGFFLAETIIVLALVTTAISFVLPNVTKVYENYKNTSKYYDQVEDIYVLKAISETDEFETTASNKTGTWCSGVSELQNISSALTPGSAKRALLNYDDLYIVSYINTPSLVPDKYSNDYEFKKYLNRLKKTSYDTTSYRLIGVFGSGKRYASIKIPSRANSCP